MRLLSLEPSMQRYRWGSPVAIPGLFGWSSDGQPIAELWFGDHPRAPATLFEARGPVSLDRALAADPALGGALGFLFKVLAAEAPLSLQCHPDPTQAARGFAAEEALGIPRDAPERGFPDDRGKEELVVALGPFEALIGVHPALTIRDAFDRAGVTAFDDRLPADDGAVAGFVAGLLRERGDVRGRALGQAAALADRGGAGRTDDAALAWTCRLVRRYPDDLAALAPLFMHHVRLALGDGLYLAPRTPHAYLGGVALELTSASDDVVRGGLTAKHVDLAALIEVAGLAPSEPIRVTPAPDAGARRYAPAGSRLRLELVDVDGVAASLPGDGRARVALALAGFVELDELELGAGDACLIAPGDAPVAVSGRGRVVVVGSAA